MVLLVMPNLGSEGTTDKNTTLNLDVFLYVPSGVGAMEIVAMDMKLRGIYIARQLSFKGVTFAVEEVPSTDEFKKTYDEAVALVSFLNLI